jgi:hypothetical protein
VNAQPPFACGQVRDTLDQPVPPPEKLTGTPLYLLDVVR